MSSNYVAVLAVSVIGGSLSAFAAGLLSGKLSTAFPKRTAWALGATVWALAIVTVYYILAIQLSVLLDPIVFACVLLVTYVSARWGYRFSSSGAHTGHSAV